MLMLRADFQTTLRVSSTGQAPSICTRTRCAIAESPAGLPSLIRKDNRVKSGRTAKAPRLSRAATRSRKCRCKRKRKRKERRAFVEKLSTIVKRGGKEKKRDEMNKKKRRKEEEGKGKEKRDEKEKEKEKRKKVKKKLVDHLLCFGQRLVRSNNGDGRART